MRFGHVVSIVNSDDPDFRKEVRDFFCKAVSYKRSA